MTFTRFALDPALLKAVKELGFTRPTPIQEQAIPPAAEGRDVLACAMTGSGKSAAFLLPIVHRLMAQRRGVTRALVLTPTRELAAQINDHFEELAVHTPVTSAAIHGGVALGPQEHALRSGVDLVVATPGRLLDHMRRPYARLADLEVLVLDEADRMLDMGFLPDIRRILRHLPVERQTMLFSATLPAEIQRMASDMLRDPVAINLARKSAPAVGITHAVYPVPRELKTALLLDLLTQKIVANAIVFTRTKHRANRVAEYLERNGIATARIHGNRSQGQRTAALDGFKNGQYQALVATDIIARGIDVEALGHVINFDVPADPDSYIHRVGRTARAEATGSAFTFVSPEEADDLAAIERAVGKRLPRVMLPNFDYASTPRERLEIPVHERLAKARAARRGAARPAGGTAARSASGAGRPAASGPGGAAGSRPRRRKPDAAARLAAVLERHGGKPVAAKPEQPSSGDPAFRPGRRKRAPRPRR